MHHEEPGLEAPGLEEVLRGTVTRQCMTVDADATGTIAPADEVFDDALTDADRSGIGRDDDVVDDTEVLAVAEVLDAGSSVANDYIVDGADDNFVIRIVDCLTKGQLERLRSCLADGPDGATATVALLDESLGGELGDLVKISDRRPACVLVRCFAHLLGLVGVIELVEASNDGPAGSMGCFEGPNCCSLGAVE